MELVSVVIANYNKKDYLKSCLESLRQQTYPNIDPVRYANLKNNEAKLSNGVEVIVVDNGSTDGSLEMIKNNFPDARLIANQQNELYCRAQNQGINQAKGKYILSLNNDTILERNYIEELVKTMGQDERIGLATGKIMLMDKKTIDTTGQFLGRSRKPIERGYRQRDVGQFETSGYVFGVGGVAALYRRKMLEEIKIKAKARASPAATLKINSEYFDETYGMFYEDLDISWRANIHGWKAFYTPAAVAYHIRGGTAKSQKPPAKLFKNYDFAYLPRELQAHLIKNRYITIIKNDSLGGIFLNLPFILLYELKLWAYICIFAPYLILDTSKNIKYINIAFKKRRATTRVAATAVTCNRAVAAER